MAKTTTTTIFMPTRRSPLSTPLFLSTLLFFLTATSAAPTSETTISQTSAPTSSSTTSISTPTSTPHTKPTATTEPTSTPESDSGTVLPQNVIAALIGIGSVAVITIIGVLIWWLVSRSRSKDRGRRIRSRQGDVDAEKSFQKAISITTAINGPESRATTPYYDEKTGVPGYDSVTMLAAGITHAGAKELGGTGTGAGSGTRSGGGDQRRASSNVQRGGNGRENLTSANIPYGGGATGLGKELGKANRPTERDSRVGGVRYDPTIWGDSWRGVNRTPSPGVPESGDQRGAGTISPTPSMIARATYSPFPKPLPPRPVFHGSGRDVARNSNNSVRGDVAYNGDVRASYGLGIGIAR